LRTVETALALADKKLSDFQISGGMTAGLLQPPGRRTGRPPPAGGLAAIRAQ